MKMLDLFCCAGGAARGYEIAGFDEIIGVDIEIQQNYPYDFLLADALSVLDYVDEFDFIHASPPCQAYSSLRHVTNGEYPDLIAATREKLRLSGKPYVIENVVGSPLENPILLCGSMFNLGTVCQDGKYRQLRRHRLFESNVALVPPGACQHHEQPIGVYGNGGGGQMTRGYKAFRDEARSVMQIDWMTKAEMAQSLPPAYTAWLGAQIVEHISSTAIAQAVSL